MSGTFHVFLHLSILLVWNIFSMNFLWILPLRAFNISMLGCDLPEVLAFLHHFGLK